MTAWVHGSLVFLALAIRGDAGRLCILVCFLVTKRLWALVAARRIECGGPWSDSLWLLLVTTSLL